jgi:hypothetical protein
MWANHHDKLLDGISTTAIWANRDNISDSIIAVAMSFYLAQTQCEGSCELDARVWFIHVKDRCVTPRAFYEELLDRIGPSL